MDGAVAEVPGPGPVPPLEEAVDQGAEGGVESGDATEDDDRARVVETGLRSPASGARGAGLLVQAERPGLEGGPECGPSQLLPELGQPHRGQRRGCGEPLLQPSDARREGGVVPAPQHLQLRAKLAGMRKVTIEDGRRPLRRIGMHGRQPGQLQTKFGRVALQLGRQGGLAAAGPRRRLQTQHPRQRQVRRRVDQRLAPDVLCQQRRIGPHEADQLGDPVVLLVEEHQEVGEPLGVVSGGTPGEIQEALPDPLLQQPPALHRERPGTGAPRVQGVEVHRLFHLVLPQAHLPVEIYGQSPRTHRIGLLQGVQRGPPPCTTPAPRWG